MNDLSASEVNTEVDTALGDYDAPTKAELDSAVASLATSSAVATVDTVVDAIKAKTDQLTFTVTNQVDSNALSGGGGLDAAGVRTAIGLSSANLDTQLADIPTVSEFEARTIVAASYFDPASDTVARVTLVDTTTTNTDMVGDATAANQASMITHLTDIKGASFSASTDTLEQIRNRGDSSWTTGGGTVGAGSVSHEVTINVGGSPESGVDVWVSTDSAGSNVVAGTLSTDAFGKATFNLDVGSYYLWVQKAETNFSNPTSFTVS